MRGLAPVLTLLPALLLALTLPTSPVWACLNDRDSLEAEVTGLPDAPHVIAGRFERNLPLFYEMRVRRVAAELRASPARLELYDDAAVACDRIGRDDEALAWIEKKRRLLERRNAGEKAVREHWYRYYANAGTFIAHRWLRAGADRSKIGEMKRARDFIKKAIQLKPNAHFGREKYQLRAMEWIVAPPKVNPQGWFPNFLNLDPDMGFVERSQLPRLGLSDAVQGLSGLIVLGNAWESVDVFNTLALALNADLKNGLAYLAAKRRDELIDQGRGTLLSGAPTGETLKKRMFFLLSPRPLESSEQLDRFYRLLRDEAESYQTRRTAYMLERLKAGRHPDTDTTFWSQWHDAGPPSPAVIRSFWFRNPWAAPLLRSFATVGIATIFLVWLTRRRRQSVAECCQTDKRLPSR